MKNKCLGLQCHFVETLSGWNISVKGVCPNPRNESAIAFVHVVQMPNNRYQNIEKQLSRIDLIFCRGCQSNCKRIKIWLSCEIKRETSQMINKKLKAWGRCLWIAPLQNLKIVNA
jgi:hypothetical protein